MNKILNIHAHQSADSERKDTVYSLSFPLEKATPNLYHSIGIHPWNIDKNIDWQLFEEQLAQPNILAIGECGLDKLRLETAMDQQIACFERQIELSERYNKPLIIHLVKATDELIKLHKAYKPSQEWIVHGFRGKPEVYQMLRSQGIKVSIGAKFNKETLNRIPLNELLIETDTSDVGIEEIAENIAILKNRSIQGLIYQIYKNTTGILFR